MLDRVLTEESYHVLSAASGAEALEIAGSAQPDLVLLDLNLSGKSGWDTFQRLTTENPLVPVIIITARPDQLFPAIASGAAALMEKPLDLAKLLRTMEGLLSEPKHVRRARTSGKRSDFHYLPPRPNRHAATHPAREK